MKKLEKAKKKAKKRREKKTVCMNFRLTESELAEFWKLVSDGHANTFTDLVRKAIIEFKESRGL